MINPKTAAKAGRQRRLGIYLVLLGALATLAATSAAWASTVPSFPCTPQPTDAVAHLACMDNSLALADARMVQTYYALRWKVGPDGQKALKNAFLTSVIGIRSKCGLPPVEPNQDQTGIPVPAGAATCVAAAYDTQRDAWIARLSGSAVEEADRAPELNRMLQGKLQALGYIPVGQRIDGVFGTDTRKALLAWEHVTSRPETGFLGDGDAYALNGAPMKMAATAPPKDPEDAMRVTSLAGPAEFDGKPLLLTAGKLSVRLSAGTLHDPTACRATNPGMLPVEGSGFEPADTCRAVTVTVMVDKKEVINGPAVMLGEDDELEPMHLTASIMQLDPATELPQVFVTGYTGGAHCCTAALLATEIAGTWKFASLGQIDGDDPWRFLVLKPGIGPVLVSYDDQFNYKFASYASSYAPTRIQRIQGNSLVEVSADPHYRAFMLTRLRKMEAKRAESSHSEPNGYLAGWVAQKATVGQAADAWKKMLTTYESPSGVTRCTVDKSVWIPQPRSPASCPPNMEVAVPFPEALALDLVENGYLTRREAASLGQDPDAIEASRKSSSEKETARFEREAARSWFVLTRTDECLMATKSPYSPADLVQRDRSEGIEDTVTVVETNSDSKPTIVRVEKPESGGMAAFTMFYRGPAKCGEMRGKELKKLEQLR